MWGGVGRFVVFRMDAEARRRRAGNFGCLSLADMRWELGRPRIEGTPLHGSWRYMHLLNCGSIPLSPPCYYYNFKKTKIMKKAISVTHAQREFLMRTFGVTAVMVSYSLNYHPEKGQSETAKKIRALALERGGVEVVCAPMSEVIHDADGMMRQYFSNGWMWCADKHSGLLELKNEHGDVIDRYEHASLEDLCSMQSRVKMTIAMCD